MLVFGILVMCLALKEERWFYPRPLIHFPPPDFNENYKDCKFEISF